MTRLLSIASLAAVLGFAGLMMGGCSPNEVTATEVRHDMTPALHSTARTTGQLHNQKARSIDHTWRQATEDIYWLLMLDKPVHLTEYPVP